MALPAPKPRDIDDTNLGLHEYRKVKLFPSTQPLTDYCNLITAASQYGLVFAGSSQAELKVILSYRNGEPHRVRTVPLPSPTTQIAVNCDCSLLAVEVLNQGTPFLQIYSVPSFLSAQVHLIETIRVCPEDNVKSRQLCWNPVIPNVLAVCLHNGGLSMYSLKDQGFEFHSLDKSNAVQSICWSPKGKQIVAGLLGFKLVQYKPDLSMARNIQCPIDPNYGPQCSVITIQWLSTYQFAVAVLGQAQDAVPNLIIVNAPKSNQISLVNYRDDICFGEPGPRAAQMFFVHLQEWNMLLVASANSPDIDLLATTEAGDAPSWVQYCIEPRVGTPTVRGGEQSFPVGITTDIGGVQVFDATGNLSAPRLSIHVMANFGELISFSVSNHLPNMKDICSPPPPARDQSGLNQFVEPLAEDQISPPASAEKAPQPQQQQQFGAPTPTTIQQSPPVAFTPPTTINQSSIKEPDMTFNFGAASTPIVQQKSMSIFGGAAVPSNPPPNSTGGLFGSSFGGPPKAAAPSSAPFSVDAVKPASTLVFPKPVTPSYQNRESQATSGAAVIPPGMGIRTTPPVSSAAAAPPPAQTKPLISVPPKFASPSMGGGEKKHGEGNKPTVTATDDEDQEALAEMMREDIAKADAEIRELIDRCKSINVAIGTKDEMKNIMKDLSGLTDFSQQAVESSDQLSAEVRMLNLSLNEAFSTTKTANDFVALYKNPEQNRLRDYMAQNPANRRKLMRLENALINNEQQMNFIQKQLMAQWAEHEEVRRQYSKDRMHIPCLEGVYETLTRQKEILFRERQKINYITNKLGVRLLSNAATGGDQQHPVDANMESMYDSMLSMTLNESLSTTQKKVDPKRMRQLTSYLAQRPVTVVCPARPKNGMNSDVILARKEKLIKSKQSGKKMVSNTATPAAASSSVKTKAPVITEMATHKPFSAPVKDIPAVAKPAFSMPNPAPVHKPPSFGGFGGMSKPVETKAKENVAPNAGAFSLPKPADSPAFSGFGVPNQKDEPAKAPASGFAFNIPKPAATETKPAQPAVITEHKSSFSFGQSSTAATATISAPAAKFNLPSSITLTAVPPTTTSTTKPLFGGISSGPLTFGASTAASVEQKPAAVQATDLSTKPAPPLNESAVLDSLKICSPSVKDKSTPPATTSSPASSIDAQKSIFSSNAFGALLGTSTTTASTTTAAAPSIFGGKVDNDAKTTAPTTATPSIFSGFGSTASPTATTAAASGTATTPSSGSLFGSGFGAATGASMFGSPAASPLTAAAAAPATGEGIKSLFGLSSSGTTTTPASTPSVAATTAPVATVAEKPAVITTTALPKPDQSVFGQVASSTTAPTTSTTSAAASAFSFGNMGLGSTTPVATTASPFGAPAAAAQGQSMFGGGGAAATAAPATGFGGAGGSLFGGTASTFGSPAASPATGTGSIFGGGSPAAAATAAAPATGGSMFGGAASGTGSMFGGAGGQGTTSVFGGGGGGAAAATNSPFGGASAAAPATGSNIFGSPSNTQSGGSIFGGGGAGAATAGGGFGSGAATGGGSIFGGGAAATASPASSGFSFANASAAPAFGSPATAVASPFGGGGAQQSPSSAFGQPQSPFGGGGVAGGAAQQGAGLFGKQAAFGSPPGFGSPATFGGPPVFGGGASFGGGFGNPQASPPQQQNNLFASLGSSDNGMSFGQIAQNNAMQQPKPAFGGSAFSSWR